jgi:polar amino acid transport system permease protein
VYSPSALELERRAYRKKQGIKSVVISLAATLVFVGIVAFALSQSDGWERVRASFFSPKYFLSSLPIVAEGLLINIEILCFACVGVAILATLIAIVRTTTNAVMFPLRTLCSIYTGAMRGIPMIVLLYLIGFGIPGLNIFGRINPIILGTAALILAYSAYVAEVLRAGIEAVHPSQIAAARSLGLSARKTLRLVVLPQAVRKVIPPLMNDFISLQKDVGLVSVLGVVDAVRSAQIEVSHFYNFTPYVVAALLFILMSIPFIILTDWYSAKVRKRELGAQQQ